MQWPQDLAAQPELPATDVDIATFIESLFAILSGDEIKALHADHKAAVGDSRFDPPFDPSSWQFPQRPLPDSYLTFLRSSNGGFFGGHNRDLDPLFNTREIRDYMLGYSIPYWMPLSLPIGFDVGGTFYLLDMRCDSVGNDCPVLFASTGNLGYDEAVTLAKSFEELIGTQLGYSRHNIRMHRKAEVLCDFQLCIAGPRPVMLVVTQQNHRLWPTHKGSTVADSISILVLIAFVVTIPARTPVLPAFHRHPVIRSVPPPLHHTGSLHLRRSN